MKILLVQLASNGDCLLVTPIAKQIKEFDYPNCHLTWLLSEKCKQVIENNPYVDEIITIPIEHNELETVKARNSINEYIDKLSKEGHHFDKIIITDLNPDNVDLYYYGTFRSSFFRIYEETTGNKIKVTPEPLIYLTDNEINNVKSFVKENKLEDSYTIIMECAPQSNQSNMNPARAINLAQKLSDKYKNVKFILSSKDKIKSSNETIIDASCLTWRENAELLNHCNLLIGSSSGITWLNATNWSKKIPMIQCVLKDENYGEGMFSASVEMDYKYFDLPTDNLIELQDPDDDVIYDCICEVIDKTIKTAKQKYKERIASGKMFMEKMKYKKIKKMQENSCNGKIIPKYSEKKIYFLGFIPFLTMKEFENKTKIYFLKIPILKIK